MDLEDPTERAAWREHLGGLVSGRKVMCALAPLAGFVDWVALLREAGARRPLLIATARGAGPVPQPDQADIVLLDVPAAASLTEEVREQDRLLRRLPAHAVRAVEAYDPDRTAGWLTSPFIRGDRVLGRAVLAGRPDAWFALEDKLVVDQLWDAVGGVRAPSRVVPLDADPLREAFAALDGAEGVVWAGDARDGLNGGGGFVRWVVDDADRSTAQEFFAGRCDRVRVMPFLDGVPCSVHGLVMPDGTAVLRPVELAVLRAGRRFVYGGLGTTWDPPSRDREEMRTLA